MMAADPKPLSRVERTAVQVMALAALCSMQACGTDFGECDEQAARTVVYTDDEFGFPSYAGQALIESSCGGGAFCHSEDITAFDRRGAPEGLDFGLLLATDAEQTERLRRDQRTVLRHRNAVFNLVQSGHMPPGQSGAEVLGSSVRYRDLPEISSSEGKAILKNWLGCRVPVVERTSPNRPKQIEPVGATVPPKPASPCEGGHAVCADACVDLQTNPQNCGACGVDCGAGGDCADAACICAASLESCDATCVDLNSDLANCGGCGRGCADGEACALGMCAELGCPPGTEQCMMDGPCVDLQNSSIHCGVCGGECGTGGSCTAGACDCGSLQWCASVTQCIDTSSDFRHCGACDNLCPGAEVCSGGTCVAGDCPGATEDCNRTCVDPQSNVFHCGACDNACRAGQDCVSGACQCSSGLESCDGSCVDTQTDPSHCGGCGIACDAGQGCVDGKCEGGCPDGTSQCAGSCVDLNSSPFHCGACDLPCGSGQECLSGQCDCGDTTSDPLNCGTCGNVCPLGTTCTDSACVCSAGLDRCGSQCIDTSTNAANCGACGVSCGGGEACQAGKCVTCGSGVGFAADIQPIFTASCADAKCHGGRRPAVNMSLEPGKAYDGLVNQPSDCGVIRVDPGGPNSSYLLNKLRGEGMCKGKRMPLQAGALAPAQISLIESWICGGAPNN